MKWHRTVTNWLLPITLMGTLATPALADLKLAEGGPTGVFYNTSRAGEGMWVEVSEAGDSVLISVSFYSFDEDGKQLWVTGTLGIDPDDTTAQVPVVQVEGPSWGPDYDPDDQVITDFGTIGVRYPDCNTAMFSIATNGELPNQDIAMVRLTDPVGIDCVNEASNPTFDSQKWEGVGTCFYVNEAGDALTDEGSTCPNGGAVWFERPGVEVDLGDNQLDACEADVTCTGVWSIVNGAASCTNQAGGIVLVTFRSSTNADLEAWQGLNGGGTSCIAAGTANAP